MLSLKVVIVFLACMLWSNCNCFNYCTLCKNHTMCLYPGVGPNCTPGAAGVSAAEKKKIVNIHNRLRRLVANGRESRGTEGGQPKAANLNKMFWDEELAAIAQRWANQCLFRHDKCRDVQRFKVGQNVFRLIEDPSLKAVDWKKIILNWYNEVKDFDSQYVSKYKYEITKADYTQIVWHSTYAVGCGRRDYGTERLAVCNYGPTGNIPNQTIYLRGKPCSKCPAGATCEDSLCYNKSWHTGSAVQGPVKSKQKRKRSFIFRKMQQEKEAL